MHNNERFLHVTSFIDRAIEEKHIPGAVVGVVTPNEVPYAHSSGFSHMSRNIEMAKDTIFDLASLTKVVATLPSILQLVEGGMLDLDDPVYLYVPQFKEFQRDITIKHLLTHTSGFQPETKFHLTNSTMAEAITEISQQKDRKKVGSEVIYSDLNFITLGYIVESITDMSLSSYASEYIYKPLGMQDTSFNPSHSLLGRMAATEYIESIKDYQWGKVHDENALHFGGVSGHAGLFSTLNDLSIFLQMILKDGIYNNKRILSKQTIDLSAKCHTTPLNLNRGIGWQLYDGSSFSGQYLQTGFGHTGFTGTSLWVSFEKQLAVILLTNRVHFGRNVDISRFRRITHNLISLAMEDTDND